MRTISLKEEGLPMWSCKGRWMFALGMICGVAWTLTSWAADWPQFLGPERDGIAHDAKDLPRSWPAKGPAVVWERPMGMGYAGPCIFGDSVLVLDREGDARDVLRRMRLSDGQDVWQFAYEAPGKLDHNGSRSTPATDGKLVFSVGPFGHIRAVNFADGKLVWQADLLKDWGAKRPNWGVAQSPLLWNDWVIFTPWGSKAAIVALNKVDGKMVWSTPNPGGVDQDYQSAVPMMLGDTPTIVSAGRQGSCVLGVDAQTGKELWVYKGYKSEWHIPSPTVIDKERVLLTGGYGAGSVMLKISKTPQGYEAKEVWKGKAMGSKIPQALLYQDHIYCNSADVSGGLKCLTLDGEIKWDSKAAGKTFDMGNLLLADGLLFLIEGKAGTLFMIEASPEGYKELAIASLLKAPEVWAPLAYSNGKLIIRDQHKMVCLDLLAQ